MANITCFIRLYASLDLRLSSRFPFYVTNGFSQEKVLHVFYLLNKNGQNLTENILFECYTLKWTRVIKLSLNIIFLSTHNTYLIMMQTP